MILCIVGTNPEAIKMAPLVAELLDKTPKNMVKLCVTGQHGNRVRDTLDLFSLKHDFEIDSPPFFQNLNELSYRIISGLDNIISENSPNLVIVHGDTTSALASTIAAINRNIPVAHIESGLRSENLEHPYPEEANRRAIDHISTILFSPTKFDTDNLLRELSNHKNIYETGNTGIDAIIMMESIINSSVSFRAQIDRDLSFINPNNRMIILSLHRRELNDISVKDITYNAIKLAKYLDFALCVILPGNRSRRSIYNDFKYEDNVVFIEPLAYPSMLYLLQKCSLIITDSGGLEEEAIFFGIPAVIARLKSERSWAHPKNCKLAGTDGRAIRSAALSIWNQNVFDKSHSPNMIFGDGLSSTRIANILIEKLNAGTSLDG